jgi:hypothetical protein
VPRPKGRQPRQPKQKGALGKRKRGPEATTGVDLDPALEDWDVEDLDDCAAIAAQLQVPLEAVPEMLADDRINDLDKVVVDAVDEDSMPGTLMKSGTIDLYVAAVAELHKIQYTTGSNKEPILRGLALRGLLENCKHS